MTNPNYNQPASFVGYISLKVSNCNYNYLGIFSQRSHIVDRRKCGMWWVGVRLWEAFYPQIKVLKSEEKKFITITINKYLRVSVQGI